MVKPRLLRRLIGINHDELGPFRQKGNKAVKFFNFELQLDLMKIDMLYALAQFQSSLCNTTGDCNEASFSSEKRTEEPRQNQKFASCAKNSTAFII